MSVLVNLLVGVRRLVELSELPVDPGLPDALAVTEQPVRALSQSA